MSAHVARTLNALLAEGVVFTVDSSPGQFYEVAINLDWVDLKKLKRIIEIVESDDHHFEITVRGGRIEFRSY